MATKNTKLVEGIGFTSGGVFGEQLGAQVEIASGPKGDTGNTGASVNDVDVSKTGETVSLTFGLDNDTDLDPVDFNVADGVSVGNVTESQADNVVTLNFTLADGTPLDPVTFNTPAGTLLEEVPVITLNDVGDGSYTLTFTYSSGTPMTTGPFTPPRGMDGPASTVPGPRGFYITDAAVAPIPGTTDTFGLTLTTNNPDEPTIDAGTFTVTEVANFPLAALTDVTLISPGYGQAVIKTGADGAADEWTNQDVSHITLHSTVQGGEQQQLRSLVETVYASDGSTSEIVWVFESIAPVIPGVPTGAFSPTGATQYASDFPAAVTLTLTADPDTGSFFSIDGTDVTTVVNVLLNGSDTSLWTATIAASDQPTSTSDTSVTTLPITLTPGVGADQISGTLRIIVEAVVDNITTAGSTTHEMVGFNFPIAEATATTMAATYSATTFQFDGIDHDEQTGSTTLTVSDGVFVGTPTISATAGDLTLGTVVVSGNTATVPFTISEPDAADTVMSTLTWDATAQPAGATGTNGETITISGNGQVITIIGEPAASPMASGSPPSDVSESAFTIPMSTVWGINSSSDLGAGEYYYALENASGIYTPRVILTGTASSDSSIQIPGTAAFPSPADGYEQRGVQVGFRSTSPDPDVFTIVENFEGVQFESFHPILLWYNQTAAAAADIEALYPDVTMAATEVIIPSTADIITGHVFTPTSGNFVMLLIPDTWQTVSAVSIVGDGNDQPVGVTVLPAGQITGIADSFGTSVLYQGFYVAGASPNVRLRIDSLS